MGMTPEVKRRIFEPFFTTKRHTGSGLGIYMVFGFIRQSGGHVDVRSKASGTTVTLYLPCGSPGAVEAAGRRLARVAGDTTILVVEDNGTCDSSSSNS